MKKTFSAIAILALAACTVDGDDEAVTTENAEAETMLEGEAPGFEAVAPGSYEVERADGSVDRITIHPGMTFSRVAADGSASGGSIFMQAGETCFVVEGVEGHSCFVDGPVQPDGSMETTSDSGDVSTVRPATGDVSAEAATGSE